jgi:hypothetical protein
MTDDTYYEAEVHPQIVGVQGVVYRVTDTGANRDRKSQRPLTRGDAARGEGDGRERQARRPATRDRQA